LAIHKRILITGSRDWDDIDTIADALVEQKRKLGADAILVSGGCPSGADMHAEKLWESIGGVVEVHPADWARHGKAAGPIRNQLMVDLGADVCLAFRKNGSRGTTHCANAATLAGIPTIWYTTEEDDD
jgi:molybdopterin biosynthesis enzyme